MGFKNGLYGSLPYKPFFIDSLGTLGNNQREALSCNARLTALTMPLMEATLMLL